MHTRLRKYFGLSPWMPIILVVIWKDIVIFTSCLIFRVLEKPRPPKEWLDGNGCFWLTHCHDHQGHYQSPTLFTPVTIVWMLVFGWTSKLAVYTPIGFIVCPPDWGRWAGTPPEGPSSTLLMTQQSPVKVKTLTDQSSIDLLDVSGYCEEGAVKSINKLRPVRSLTDFTSASFDSTLCLKTILYSVNSLNCYS